jgi:hypothetical protein
MNKKPDLKKFFRLLTLCLLGLLLLNSTWIALPTDNSYSELGNRIVYAQDGPGDDDDDGGQGHCPDGVTSVPSGVYKAKFCRDNGKPPGLPDFLVDLWCRLIARFRMHIPLGFRYRVICVEEAPALPPGIREVDFRIVTLHRVSDDQERKEHIPPLFWKLLNAQDFAGPNDTVVLLRWNDDIEEEPAKWEFVPGTKNEDGTIDYLISNTSLFAVGLSDDPNIAATFMAPDTVIPAGLPRTGIIAGNLPVGIGILFVMGLAVAAAVGLRRWRSQ